MREEWKPIAGYEGLYKVSNLGRVCNTQKVLKQTVSRKGYARVGLHKNGNLKTIEIHRLVAQAFLDNPNGFPEVNHKDENKLNNMVENLEWCTRKHNVTYGNRQKKATETKNRKCLTRQGRIERIKAIFDDISAQSSIDCEMIDKYKKELNNLLNSLRT